MRTEVEKSRDQDYSYNTNFAKNKTTRILNGVVDRDLITLALVLEKCISFYHNLLNL